MHLAVAPHAGRLTLTNSQCSRPMADGLAIAATFVGRQIGSSRPNLHRCYAIDLIISSLFFFLLLGGWEVLGDRCPLDLPFFLSPCLTYPIMIPPRLSFPGDTAWSSNHCALSPPTRLSSPLKCLHISCDFLPLTGVSAPAPPCFVPQKCEGPCLLFFFIHSLSMRCIRERWNKGGQRVLWKQGGER